MVGRRQFVCGLGSLTLAGALAGCAAPTAGGGEERTETATPTATATATPAGVPSAVSTWLSNVGNYDGSVADRTGQGEVTVQVGAEGNGGAFAFAPPAIRVDAGATVVWEWTGEGGQHNVVAGEGADFAAELASEAGHTFSRAFESAGVVTYYCEPHRSLGMKGAVVVR